MSSVERDLADYVRSVYDDASRTDLESMTKEELIEYIRSEAQAAKSAYIDFGVAYGWYDNYDEGEEDFREEEDEAPEEVPTVYYMRVTAWLANKRGWDDTRITVAIIRESWKAYYCRINDEYEWIPKSQIMKFSSDRAEVFEG